MSTNVTWNGTTYSIPASGETGWSALSSFLIALGNGAAVAEEMKQAIRVATTSPVTVSDTTDCVIAVNRSVAGATTVNLPAGTDGRWFVICDQKADAATNNITVTPNGAETINGSATYVMSQNNEAIVIAYSVTNTRWNVVARFTSGAPLSNPMATTGDMIYGGASGTPTKLATATTTGLLHGGNGAVPTWSLLVDADVSGSAAISGSKVVAAASGVIGVVTATTQTITGIKTFETQLIGKGTGTNDSAATGYIGEYREAGSSTFGSAGTSNQYFDAGSITLVAGDWDVYGSILWKRNGATTATPDFEIGISGTTGNASTGLAQGINYLYDVASDAAAWTNKQQNIGPIRVQSDGTNLYINGTTFSSVQVCYLKGLIVYSAGTPQYCYLIRARRVR